MNGRVKQERRGGRTERNRKSVASAVLKLLERGSLEFEIQEVATLSGVHRTTIFRRWPDRGALIAEALAEHVARFSVEFTGDWKADMRRIAYRMRDMLSDPIEMAMNRMLFVTENPAFHEQMLRYWTPVLTSFQQPILEAQARGELDTAIDAEMLLSALMSTLLTNAMLFRAPGEDAFVERLVAQLLEGCPGARADAGPAKTPRKKR